MKIAVTYENEEIFQHFGHTERFKIYNIENNKIIDSSIVDTNGSGHGALADMLKKINVEILICGGIGGGAKSALEQAGIRLYGGASGKCDDAVQALLDDKLTFNPSVECNHHEHHGGENCGEHDSSCGGHCHK